MPTHRSNTPYEKTIAGQLETLHESLCALGRAILRAFTPRQRAEYLIEGLTGRIATQVQQSPILAAELDWQTAHEHRHFPPIPRHIQKRDERVLVTYGTTRTSPDGRTTHTPLAR